jgi:holo-[acyl-carrier protein] synthase
MGVDIAEVDRIRKAIERHGETFLRRLYTEKERDYCEQFKNKYERYAGRFAAKEAGMKALGTGWRHGVRWVDLEVVREKSGRPTLQLAGEAEKIAKQIGVKHIALSITHTEEQGLRQTESRRKARQHRAWKATCLMGLMEAKWHSGSVMKRPRRPLRCMTTTSTCSWCRAAIR